MPVTCPCHAEPYRTVQVGEFTYQVCATVARAIEAEWRDACAQVCKDHEGGQR